MGVKKLVSFVFHPWNQENLSEPDLEYYPHLIVMLKYRYLSLALWSD